MRCEIVRSLAAIGLVSLAWVAIPVLAALNELLILLILILILVEVIIIVHIVLLVTIIGIFLVIVFVAIVVFIIIIIIGICVGFLATCCWRRRSRWFGWASRLGRSCGLGWVSRL